MELLCIKRFNLKHLFDSVRVNKKIFCVGFGVFEQQCHLRLKEINDIEIWHINANRKKGFLEKRPIKRLTLKKEESR